MVDLGCRVVLHLSKAIESVSYDVLVMDEIFLSSILMSIYIHCNHSPTGPRLDYVFDWASVQSLTGGAVSDLGSL